MNIQNILSCCFRKPIKKDTNELDSKLELKPTERSSTRRFTEEDYTSRRLHRIKPVNIKDFKEKSK